MRDGASLVRETVCDGHHILPSVGVHQMRLLIQRAMCGKRVLVALPVILARWCSATGVVRCFNEARERLEDFVNKQVVPKAVCGKDDDVARLDRDLDALCGSEVAMILEGDLIRGVSDTRMSLWCVCEDDVIMAHDKKARIADVESVQAALVESGAAYGAAASHGSVTHDALHKTMQLRRLLGGRLQACMERRCKAAGIAARIGSVCGGSTDAVKHADGEGVGERGVLALGRARLRVRDGY